MGFIMRASEVIASAAGPDAPIARVSRCGASTRLALTNPVQQPAIVNCSLSLRPRPPLYPLFFPSVLRSKIIQLHLSTNSTNQLIMSDTDENVLKKGDKVRKSAYTHASPKAQRLSRSR